MGYICGLYWDNGKDNGNYYSGEALGLQYVGDRNSCLLLVMET